MSQSERLHYIDTAIREKGIVTVQELAQKFEVSPLIKIQLIRFWYMPMFTITLTGKKLKQL